MTINNETLGDNTFVQNYRKKVMGESRDSKMGLLAQITTFRPLCGTPNAVDKN